MLAVRRNNHDLLTVPRLSSAPFPAVESRSSSSDFLSGLVPSHLRDSSRIAWNDVANRGCFFKDFEQKATGKQVLDVSKPHTTRRTEGAEPPGLADRARRDQGIIHLRQ